MRVRDIFLFDQEMKLLSRFELSCVATIMSVCKIGDNDKLLCFKFLLIDKLEFFNVNNKAAL